jgi:flagellar hook assembly protein FlgD
MATSVEHMTELTMKLRLSKRASEKLSQRATKTGQEVSVVASDLIEQAVTQPSFQEPVVVSTNELTSAAISDDETVVFAEETVTYNPAPPRRSYTVQVAVSHRGRGVPAPFELDAE